MKFKCISLCFFSKIPGRSLEKKNMEGFNFLPVIESMNFLLI